MDKNREMLTEKKIDYSSSSATLRRALTETKTRQEQNMSSLLPKEIGGRGGSDPTRYGDWEVKGRAIDF